MKLFYPTRGDFVAVVGDIRTRKHTKRLFRIYKNDIGIKSSYLIAPKFLPGVAFSDHRNYWGYKYPALMVTDGAMYRNKNYHTPEDTPATLDYDKMAMVVDGVKMFLLKKL